MRHFDGEVVLCGGMRFEKEAYAPATFEDGNVFGMAGGHIRVVAAAHHFWHGVCNKFLFSTGVSQKETARHGEVPPTEASVYGRALLKILSSEEDAKHKPRRPLPEVLLEDTSPNTVKNLQNSFAMVEALGWQSVGVLSSDYHIPRIQALFGLLVEGGYIAQPSCNVSFVGAESSLRELVPGQFDAEIDAAYATKSAQVRFAAEQRGLDDILAGRYKLGEQTA